MYLDIYFCMFFWFLAPFGDSLKRSMVYTVCTPRQRGQVLPSRDSLPRVHDVGPDGTAVAAAPSRIPRHP
jgi:hypothetical protein